MTTICHLLHDCCHLVECGRTAGSSCWMPPPSQLNERDDTVPRSWKIIRAFISVHGVSTVLSDGYTFSYLSFGSITFSVHYTYCFSVYHMVFLVDMITNSWSMPHSCWVFPSWSCLGSGLELFNLSFMFFCLYAQLSACFPNVTFVAESVAVKYNYSISWGDIVAGISQVWYQHSGV